MKFFISVSAFQKKVRNFPPFFFFFFFAFIDLLQNRRKKELVLKIGDNFKDQNSLFFLLFCLCANKSLSCMAVSEWQCSLVLTCTLSDSGVKDNWLEDTDNVGCSVGWTVLGSTVEPFTRPGLHSGAKTLVWTSTLWICNRAHSQSPPPLCAVVSDCLGPCAQSCFQSKGHLSF